MPAHIDPLIRLTANNNGEVRCVVLSRNFNEAKRGLYPYVSRLVKSYPFISGFGALVHVHALDDLSRLPFVKSVTANATVYADMNLASKQIHADSLGIRGLYAQGVSVAVIDTGVYPHLDFLMPCARIAVFEDFLSGGRYPYDDNGHGSAVSSILLGNGLVSNGRYAGIAPKARLIALKAMDAHGEGSAFHILEAMQWIYQNREKHNIKVVVMSFGTPPLGADDPLVLGAEVLWRSGVTVVASAGNSGPKQNTVTSPGISPLVLTVGGAGFESGEPYVPDFSSRGEVDGIVKPDIVAPAVDIRCCDTAGGYTTLTGTSMSTPVVAGLAAHILALRPSFTPDRVKDVILSAAVKLSDPSNACGSGLADARAILSLIK